LLLSNPVAVWFGKISYPLYLWHWPMLVFLRIMMGDTPIWFLRAGVIVTAIALSWLTYRFIEKPIRFDRMSPQPLALAA
jgi:peptidoglycan/LPS O-acetylase OafA/YrhL